LFAPTSLTHDFLNGRVPHTFALFQCVRIDLSYRCS